jgi:hypothetical protein
MPLFGGAEEGTNVTGSLGRDGSARPHRCVKIKLADRVLTCKAGPHPIDLASCIILEENRG